MWTSANNGAILRGAGKPIKNWWLWLIDETRGEAVLHSRKQVSPSRGHHWQVKCQSETAAGLLQLLLVGIWIVNTQYPTFSVSILVPLTSLIYTCTLQVLIEKWASFLFSTERKIILLLTGFVILGGISKEITFNTVGIKPSYSYSRGWEENSLLSAVRPICTSLAFFFLSLNSFSLSE